MMKNWSLSVVLLEFAHVELAVITIAFTVFVLIFWRLTGKCFDSIQPSSASSTSSSDSSCCCCWVVFITLDRGPLCGAYDYCESTPPPTTLRTSEWCCSRQLISLLERDEVVPLWLLLLLLDGTTCCCLEGCNRSYCWCCFCCCLLEIIG